MSSMIFFNLKFPSASLSLISRFNFLWRIEHLSNISRTTWIVAIISSLILHGSLTCRSMLVNTIKLSHHSGSRTCSTTFHWVRWSWHTSPLPNSLIRARSLFSQVSWSLFCHIFYLTRLTVPSSPANHSHTHNVLLSISQTNPTLIHLLIHYDSASLCTSRLLSSRYIIWWCGIHRQSATAICCRFWGA